MDYPVCKLGPSILNADLSQLLSESERLINAGADYLHLDVMDGHFVPNLTFGHPVVKCLRKHLKSTFFDMHMMVSDPEKWIEPMNDAGADQYTFHVEATEDIPRVCRKIKESGMMVGIGIKPGTPVDLVMPYIDQADMILIMTVEPGFGGQSFMKDMLSKVEILRKKFPLLSIGLDGGVGLGNIHDCAKAGANMIVSGSAVTGASDPVQVISSMKQTLVEVFQKNHPHPL